MNHNYRLIWNRTYRCWQAVSELAKGKLKSDRVTQSKPADNLSLLIKLSVIVASGLMGISVATAAPTGGVVSTGSATISTSGTTTTINQSTAKAAIDWSSFSTGVNETVNFVQPNRQSITLNRVVGTNASTLNGKLNANGQVFIINPNGVLFGTSSQVNVGGLVASTLGLDNANFLSGNYTFSDATNNKTVENRGKITAGSGGTIAMLAPTVKQTGTLSASNGSVLLAAGSDITLNLNNGSLLGYTINQGKAQALINSGGLIQADAGKVILTAKGVDELSNAVVNSVGVIQARTVSNVRGVIELGSDMQSGTVNVAGTLDASAPNGGNGGQIKTQAANVTIGNNTNITTARLNQNALPPTTSGWELKANNIDINFFGGNLDTATLNSSLEKGNVTLTAVQGDINLNDHVGWTANTALTLDSAQNLNFNGDLDLSGDKAKLVMNYGSDYDYNLNNGSKINITGATPILLINGTSYTVINALGEEADANLDTLQGMQNNLTGNFALGSDIDATDTANWNNGKGFDPIGQTLVNFDMVEPVGTTPFFKGSFHGLGHEINSLRVNNSNSPLTVGINVTGLTTIPQGLFSVAQGDIRDVGLVNANIKGDAYVGALVGLHYGGVIKNAYSTGSTEGLGYIGGLIGGAKPQFKESLSSNKIVNSYSESNVRGVLASGGLVGASTTSIYDSYATGNISLPDFIAATEDQDFSVSGGFMAGGLVGIGQGIYNSYATGDITKGTHINGNWYNNIGFYGVGGLAGAVAVENSEHYIDNSYATGNISGAAGVAGLVGVTVGRDTSIPKLVIKNSYATGNVLGNQTVGGLVAGVAPGDIIEGSYSTGVVTGISEVGGLVGNNNGGIIINSYSTSTTTGEDKVGGLIGWHGSYHTGTIENSYSSGAVTGVTNVGGLVGMLSSNSTVINSYWNTDTSGQLTSAGGIGKTTVELQSISTFSGWDIADVSDLSSNSVWVIDEDNQMPWLRQFN